MTTKVVNNMAMEALADWLNEELDSRHMSIRELSRESGVAHSTLNKIAKAVPGYYPSVDTLIKLSEYTKTDVCALMGLIAPHVSHADAETRILVDRVKRLPPHLRVVAENFLRGTRLQDSE